MDSAIIKVTRDGLKAKVVLGFGGEELTLRLNRPYAQVLAANLLSAAGVKSIEASRAIDGALAEIVREPASQSTSSQRAAKARVDAYVRRFKEQRK